jgi:hypothetical protein
MINHNMIDMLSAKGITVLIGLGLFSLTILVFGIVVLLYLFGLEPTRTRRKK